ncbi:MAG: CRISPR-associated endonuclease Cas2 [Patescibacteria group bacterium]
MGAMEERVGRSVRATKLNKAVIGTLATVGIIALAVLAPNAVGALGKIGFLPQRKYQTKKAISRLIDSGHIRIEVRDGNSFARLTEKGESLARLMHVGKVVPRKPKRWDGKWRLVMFDIPERRRRDRARAREMLKLFKLYRLQDSVWVYPYDCEELIVLLKADLKIGKDMLYVIADAIEHDGHLRRHFNLGA